MKLLQFGYKRNNPIRKWHTWFAWRPVFIQTEDGDQLIWLETVHRLWQQYPGYGYWKYQTL